MGWTATAEVLDQGVPAVVAANDNAPVAGRVAWYRNYHRYYDPQTGRYTQPDPFLIARASFTGPSGAVEFATAVLPPSVEPYSYVGNEPMTRLDPTGERWINGGRESLDCSFETRKDSSCDCGKERRVLVCRWRVCQGWMWEQEGSGNLWASRCYGANWYGGPNASRKGDWEVDSKVVREFDCVNPRGFIGPPPLDFNGPRAYASAG